MLVTAFNIITSVLVVVLLTACSTAPIKLTNEYNEPDKIDLTHETLYSKPIQCRLNVQKIEDQRTNKQAMGSLGSQYVCYDNLIDWIKNGFKSLNKVGYLVSFAEEEFLHDDRYINIELVIKKAYIRSSATSKNSNLVLSVRYFTNGQLLGRNTYRGSHTNVNWASSESEVKKSFNISLEQILSGISVDVNSYCSKVVRDNLHT